MKKNHLYIIILVLISFILAILLGAFNRGNVKFNDEVLSVLKTSHMVAAIAVDENGDISMVSSSGKPAKKCSFKPKSKNQCKGISKGIISIETITLIKTIGSWCYTRVKPDGTKEQVCYPEE